jgi:hypothetical protein
MTGPGVPLPLIFTDLQGIVTNIVAIGSLACYAVLLSKDDNNNIYFGGFSSTAAKKVFAAASSFSLLQFGLGKSFSGRGKLLSFPIPTTNLLLTC